MKKQLELAGSRQDTLERSSYVIRLIYIRASPETKSALQVDNQSATGEA